MMILENSGHGDYQILQCPFQVLLVGDPRERTEGHNAERVRRVAAVVVLRRRRERDGGEGRVRGVQEAGDSDERGQGLRLQGGPTLFDPETDC